MKTSYILAVILGGSLAGAANAQLAGGLAGSVGASAGQVGGAVGTAADAGAQLPDTAATVDRAATRVEAAKDRAEARAERARARAENRVENTRLPTAGAHAGVSAGARAETPAAKAGQSTQADVSASADPN